MNRNALICRNSILREIPLQDLNMEESPFAGGWNGWVTKGMYKGIPVAVKSAIRHYERGKVLFFLAV
jgi:hypothetical protein